MYFSAFLPTFDASTPSDSNMDYKETAIGYVVLSIITLYEFLNANTLFDTYMIYHKEKIFSFGLEK
jgi:hypothetical protein